MDPDVENYSYRINCPILKPKISFWLGVGDLGFGPWRFRILGLRALRCGFFAGGCGGDGSGELGWVGCQGPGFSALDLLPGLIGLTAPLTAVVVGVWCCWEVIVMSKLHNGKAWRAKP